MTTMVKHMSLEAVLSIIEHPVCDDMCCNGIENEYVLFHMLLNAN